MLGLVWSPTTNKVYIYFSHFSSSIIKWLHFGYDVSLSTFLWMQPFIDMIDVHKCGKILPKILEFSYIKCVGSSIWPGYCTHAFVNSYLFSSTIFWSILVLGWITCAMFPLSSRSSSGVVFISNVLSASSGRSSGVLGTRHQCSWVGIDPLKIQAVVDWLVPQSTRLLHGFLSSLAASYYWQFIKDFGSIAPLTMVLKKERFCCSSELASRKPQCCICLTWPSSLWAWWKQWKLCTMVGLIFKHKTTLIAKTDLFGNLGAYFRTKVADLICKI